MRGGHARYIQRIPAEAALRIYRSDQNEQNYVLFKNARDKYQKHFSIEAGLRHIQRDGDTIILDVKPVSFPPYNLFGKPESRKELLDLSVISSTTSILVTEDNKLLVQIRDARNASFGNVPGASASGYLDIAWNRKKGKKRKPQRLTTKGVLKNAYKELYEEIGIKKNMIENASIAGMVFDDNVVHEEFLILAKTSLSSDELKQQRVGRKDRKMNSEEFDEKYVFIDATPEAITTLLTGLACPIPTSHQAAFVTCGYQLMMAREGKAAADLWKKSLAGKIQQNTAKINQIVNTFYQTRPEMTEHIPQRLMARVENAVNGFVSSNPHASDEQIQEFRLRMIQNLPKRDTHQYDPNFLPEEQGLLNPVDAMKIAGLINNQY